jgi:predicted Mrr-cat superfamily restriction endonuclease
MTMCLPPEFSLKRDGDTYWIINNNTGWESERFGLEDIRVLWSGHVSDMKKVFDLKVVVK